MRWDGMMYWYEDGSGTTGSVTQFAGGYAASFKGKWIGRFYATVAEAKAAVEAAWREDREGTSKC